jgi:hypothetical protein
MEILLIISIVLSLFGIFRSQINGSKPSGLIDLKDTTNNWISDKSWISRLTPLFSGLVIVYNLLLWIVNGLNAIVDIIKYIFNILRIIILWVWNNIIHPTLFLSAKVVWHYLIVFLWKLLLSSISSNKLKEVFKRKNIIFSFKVMVQIFSVSILFFFISRLFDFGQVANYILILISLVFIQFQIFESTNFFTSSSSSAIRKIKIVGTSIASSMVFFGLVLLFKNHSEKIVLQGLGITIAQISIPIILISLYVFIISTFFIAPYLNKKDDNSFDLFDFLKQSSIRIFKYFYSLPFHFLGILIASIVPIIIALILSFGINFTTNMSMPEWYSTANNISSFIPSIKQNKNYIKSVKSEVLQQDSIYKNDIAIVDSKIEDLTLIIDEVEELKSLLFPNQIFSFEGDPFVGETQKFSFLETISASNYVIKIIKSSNDSIIREFVKYQINKREDGIINTYVFNHKWNNSGSYRIEISPKNSCETGKPFSKIINVEDKPEQKLAFKNPTGKNLICAGDTVFFKADQSKWVESWHWELPEGCKYISEDTESKIEVVWGNQPGTIRVYGVGAKGENQISVTKGLLVNIIPKIGYPIVYVEMIDDETINYFKYPSREELFYTMIDAEKEISSLSDSLNSASNSKLEIENSFSELQSSMNNQISNYNDKISDIRIEIFGVLLALIGFVLFFSILFTNLWTFMVNYNYFIYDYEQEGIHYINSQISFYKEKNKNQPLLGWAILLLFSFLLFGILNLG